MLLKTMIRTLVLLLLFSLSRTTVAKSEVSGSDGSISFNCVKKAKSCEVLLSGYPAGPKIILLKKRNKSRGIHNFIPKISDPTIALVYSYSDYFFAVSHSNFASYLLSQIHKRGPPVV